MEKVRTSLTKELKELKELRTKYTCTLNPFKRKVFDFKKGKQIKYKDDHPRMGYICPTCSTAYTYLKHYLVDGVSMCEECALKKIVKSKVK